MDRPAPDQERFFRLGLDQRAVRIALSGWRWMREDGDQPEDAVQEMLLRAWTVFLAYRHLPDDEVQRLVARSCRNHRSDLMSRATVRTRCRGPMPDLEGQDDPEDT